jgi:hypothetical protein
VPRIRLLFLQLTEAQVKLLARHGEVRPAAVGNVLVRQGSETYDVIVVLEATVSVLVRVRRTSARWSGGSWDLMVELNLFTGQGTGAIGIVREPGSVLAIAAGEFASWWAATYRSATSSCRRCSPPPSTRAAAARDPHLRLAL